MNDKIAVSMIVKGTPEEAVKLDRVLNSVEQHVDAVFVTLTGDEKETEEARKVCYAHKVNLSQMEFHWVATNIEIEMLTSFFGYAPQIKKGDKVFVFDQARNYNMALIDPEKFGWILWLDCDDVILRGENLRTLIEQSHKNSVDAYYFNYIYQAEMDGDKIKHILIQHLRERLVKNNGAYKWIAPIHETLIEQRPTVKTDTDACEVLHLSEEKDRMESLTRNLKTLEIAIYQTKGEDPRHIYYLAKAFFDLNTPEYNEKALKLILEHYVGGNHMSGWQEERAQAWEYTAEIYRRQGKFDKAIEAGLHSLKEDPENPSPFISIALSYVRSSEWERALFWVRLAAQIPQKKTTLVTNPKDIQARTLEIIFNCCLNMAKVDEAWASIVKLSELFPNDPKIIQNVQFMQGIKDQRDLTKKVVELASYLKRSGEQGKIKALLHALPATIQNNPFMVDLYKQNNPPKFWGEKEIAIYCGQGFTPWSPKKLTDPGECFVGGSEEAVIYAAEALQRAGWKVTVYNDCSSDEGEINGVQWLPYYKLNHFDHFNILIGWRDIRFFDSDFIAKKKYLWCHDIQQSVEYTKERVDKINKVFFLSQWHRKNVPSLPDSKVFLTSNGVI